MDKIKAAEERYPLTDYLAITKRSAFVMGWDAALSTQSPKLTDEDISNAASNHQLGGYDWQSEKRKSFEDGAKWARMSLSAPSSTQSPKWELCPKCLGDGNLSRYNSPAIVSTSCTPVCDVCNGAKVLLSPSSTHPMQEKIDGLRAGLQSMADEGYDCYDTAHHLTVQRWLKNIETLLKTYK